jgi:hypothetical protein
MREDQNVVGSREKVILLSPHQQHTHTTAHTQVSFFFFFFWQNVKIGFWWTTTPSHYDSSGHFLSFGFVGQNNFFSLFFFFFHLFELSSGSERLFEKKKKMKKKKEAQPIPSPGLFVLSSDTKTLWKKKRSKANSLNEKMRHVKCERKGGGSNHFPSPPPKSPHRPYELWDLLHRLAFFFFPLVTHTTGADQVCGT